MSIFLHDKYWDKQFNIIYRIYYINNFLDSSPDNKCLIFGHHRDVLDGIESNISAYRQVDKKGKKKRIAYIRIDGSTPHRERADNVRKFHPDLLCQATQDALLLMGPLRT